MPGIKKEEIAPSPRGGSLTLSVEPHHEREHDEKSRVRNEPLLGRFERTITVPAQVDGTKVTATYENGLLTVTLPKVEAAKLRQIEISGFK